VTASLVAPDGTSTVVDSGQKPAGTYTFAESTFPVEGTWHWTVEATDDLGRSSTIDRTFRYDATLRGLVAPRAARGSATFRFTLSRPASVQLQVESPTGVVVRSLPPAQLPAGPGAVTWDGRLPAGSPAYGGSYVAVLTVTSAVGTSNLQVAFSFRR
jgi:flagellar hook assembly protein FlgD